MYRKLTVWLIAVAAGTANLASAQTVEHKSLNLDGAKMVIDRTVAKAAEVHAPGGAITVVDNGGNLLAVERLDGTFPASANISIGKARTAALFKKPTKVFEEIVNHGRTTMVALNDFTPLQGGVPILLDGQVVGAVGVSGAASAEQDEELAQAGAASFADVHSRAKRHEVGKPVMLAQTSFSRIDRDTVREAFAKGMPLLETPDYKIHASRRTEPGMAEVHDHETDVVYVVSGSATLVTGGLVVEPKTTAVGETRGAAIDGGESTRVTQGDVFVVPAGMPHWFKEVDGPFLYFVVKPISNH